MLKSHKSDVWSRRARSTFSATFWDCSVVEQYPTGMSSECTIKNSIYMEGPSPVQQKFCPVAEDPKIESGTPRLNGQTRNSLNADSRRGETSQVLEPSFVDRPNQLKLTAVRPPRRPPELSYAHRSRRASASISSAKRYAWARRTP